MTGPEQGGNYVDLGAQAMATTASLDEVTTISTAQTMNGLSTLLVSEGLSKLVRDMLMPGIVQTPGLQTAPQAQTTAGPEGEKADREEPSAGGSGPAEKEGLPKPAASRDGLVGMSSQALGELLTRSMVNRIVDLNTVNTYLALATSEQLRQWGKQMASTYPAYSSTFGYGPVSARPTAPPAPAFPFPPLRGQPAAAWGPSPYPGWTGPWAYPPRPAGYPGYCFLPSNSSQ